MIFLYVNRTPYLVSGNDYAVDVHSRSRGDVKVRLTGATITTAIPKSRWVDFMARRAARISSSR